MNGVVKREGIGIQVHDMMRNMKTSHASNLTDMRALNLAILAALSDDERYSQHSVMIHTCLATTNSKLTQFDISGIIYLMDRKPKH